MINKLKIKNNTRGFTPTPKELFGVSSAKAERGFTLIEVLIAITIFILIATFAIGAVLGIFDSNNRARSSKTVVDNLNFSIENMVRTVRFGEYYYCGYNTNLTTTSNCGFAPSDTLSVTFFDIPDDTNVRVIYRKNGTAIERSYAGGEFKAITAPEAKIEELNFYVIGAGVFGADLVRQPYVIAVIKGYVGDKPSSKSSFNIQTLMSQRMLEYD